jgi:hypothetical protein
MRKIPKAIYQTPAEIEERIRKLEADTMSLRADTDEHRQVMQDISKLRIYADAKRWLASPTKGGQGAHNANLNFPSVGRVT